MAGPTVDPRFARVAVLDDRQLSVPATTATEAAAATSAAGWTGSDASRPAWRPAPLIARTDHSAGTIHDAAPQANPKGLSQAGQPMDVRKPPTAEELATAGDAAGRTDSDEVASELPPLVVPISPIDPQTIATVPAALAWILPESRDPLMTHVTGRLADEFIDSVTKGSVDPGDTDYQRRWREAQEESDARMRSSLGGHAWLDHHREVHRQLREEGEEFR